MNFIDLNEQFRLMETDINAGIQKVFNNGNFIMGEEVEIFESQLSSFIDVKHTISCANGTDALHLALMAIGVGPGDSVLTTTFSFFSTAEAIRLVGANPIFVDVDINTFNIDVEKVKSKIDDIFKEGKILPKAIIAVDLFGLPANYPELIKVAKKYDIKLVEDAAQGLGGEINGKIAGSYGDIATTSFFPAKPLGCYGDGGALFTNDNSYAEILRSLRVHGKGTNKYDNVRIGMNSRLDTIQAAILIVKLKSFKNEIKLRNNIAKKYHDALNNKRFRLPINPTGFKSTWAQYSILAESSRDRENIMKKLKSNGVPSIIYYEKPLHLQTAFRDLKYTEGDFPVSEDICNRVFSIPMSPYLSDEHFDKIINTLSSI